MDEALNFGLALQMLKQGSKVQRQGWNGKGMWLALVKGNEYYFTSFPHVTNDTPGELLPWIGMRTADNKFVPWLASQTDILSEDWYIVL